MAITLDVNKVLNARATFERRIKNGRQEILRNTYENVLYYLGHHHISFDITANRFRKINLRKDTPRPVTNKYKAILDSIDAVLARVEPSLSFAPGSDKDDDRLTADMAKQCVKYLEKEVHLQDIRAEISKGVVTCNNMYTFVGYDPDGGKVERVPKWECPAHPAQHYDAKRAMALLGKCPKDGQPLQPSTDAFDEIPAGEVYIDLASPFETWVDLTVKHMRDQPYVMLRRMRQLDWVHNKYEGAKGRVSEDSSPSDIGITYLQSIIRLTPGSSFTSFGSGARYENSVLVDDFYALPNADFPEGCFARIAAGDVVLEAIPLPTHEGTPEKPGRKFIPCTHWRYDDVLGAHYATGPADHLKPLQRQRNRLQASVELYFSRFANGVWWIPEGLDVKMPPGEQGGIIRGNSQFGEPKRIEGGRLPNSFGERFEKIDAEMEDIAGMYDIMRGERPPNVDSGYALTILENRAQGRLASLYLGWERSYGETARHLFHIFRNNAPDEVYFAIKGERARWSVAKIKAADLHGGVDIDVEAGSAQPKTLLQKRASLEQAAQMQLVDLTDQKVRLQYLRSLGISELAESLNADDEAIAREEEEVVAWAEQHFDMQSGKPNEGEDPRTLALPVLVDRDLDNHELHYERHRTWMISEEFKALPKSVQEAFRMGHFLQHVAILQEQMAAQQAAQAPQQGAAGAKAGVGDKQGEGNAAANEKGGGTTGREQRKAERAESGAAA